MLKTNKTYTTQLKNILGELNEITSNYFWQNSYKNNKL